MSPLDPLESRSLSTGLAQRTLKNLAFVQGAHARGEDVHLVTQMLNSLLGLFLFPVEKERQFFGSFSSVKLSDPPDFTAVHQLHEFPLLPSLQCSMFGNCKNLRRFIRRLRNAIAHRHFEIHGESHDLSAVMIRLYDHENEAPVDWDITLSAEDLGQICSYIADQVIRHHL
jgi:HEPN pEK499 p136